MTNNKRFLNALEKMSDIEQRNIWRVQAKLIKKIEGSFNQLNKLKEYGYESFRNFFDITGIRI